MKALYLALLAGSAIALSACEEHTYTYRHVYHHEHTSGDYVPPGSAERLNDHHSPEEFHAQSNQ